MVTIIDYNAGNIISVQRALNHLGVENCITEDPQRVRVAEKLVFPGVGHAGAAMQEMRKRGLDGALKDAFHAGTPILGICVGCQILMSHSDEGDTTCMDIIPGGVHRFDVDTALYKVPHMGWNDIRMVRPHEVMEGCGSEFYFVHSYYISPADKGDVVAVCDHGIEFPAVIAKGNLIAVQFHPEKSGRGGLQLLENFAAWKGN